MKLKIFCNFSVNYSVIHTDKEMDIEENLSIIKGRNPSYVSALLPGHVVS
jgi:hypothetical protein